VPAATGPADLHQVPDVGAGERVPLQPLPDPAAAHRDRPRTLSDRAPDQDLVPEQEDEAEEGVASGEGDQRAGQAGARGTREAQAAAAGEAAEDRDALLHTPAPPRPHEDGAGQGRRLGPPQSRLQSTHIRCRCRC
jgi:hypothetical protein